MGPLPPLWPPPTPTMAATAMERGPPMLMLRLSLLPRPSLRLMPTGAVMALAMVVTDTARGPLMPTMAAMAMAVMALAMVATDTARGPLMPMPTMAVMALAAMAVTAMVGMDTARGPLMPTTATATAVTAMAATATASKPTTNLKVRNSILTPKLSSQNIIHNSAAWKIDGCVSFNYQPNNK